MVVKPLLGFRLLPLGTGAVTTGMLDAVVGPAALALIQAVTVSAALALLAGTDALTVREGEGGVALPVCWRKGGKDGAAGDHGRSSCLRALRRS